MLEVIKRGLNMVDDVENSSVSVFIPVLSCALVRFLRELDFLHKIAPSRTRTTCLVEAINIMHGTLTDSAPFTRAVVILRLWKEILAV